MIFAAGLARRRERPLSPQQEIYLARWGYPYVLEEFRFHWRANGHAYGIGHEVREWLAQGLTVVVNGSRAYLPHALADFPALEVVHITAALEALRMRLEARGRETHEQIQRRIERGDALRLPSEIPYIEIRNDAELGTAGRALLGCLLARA